MLRLRSRMFALLVPALLGIFVLTPTEASAQQMEDVVYLKDGSVIRGTIVEQRPGESILIRTRDGNQFRYPITQIDRIAKEASPVAVSSGGEKSPGVAWLLSFLITGAGQAYNGQWGKGAVFFGTSVIGYGVMLGGLNTDECTYYDDCGAAGVGALVWLGSWIWSQIDAPITASSMNRRRRGLVELDLRPRVEVLTRTVEPSTSLRANTNRITYSGNTWGVTLATLRF